MVLPDVVLAFEMWPRLWGSGFLIIVCGVFSPACGAAWTLDEGQGQILAEATYSHANHSFRDDTPVILDKLFIKDDYEYGFSDGVTLFSIPEYVSASVERAGVTLEAKQYAFSSGARVRLSDAFGQLSAQLSYAHVSAFTMTVAGDAAGGHEAELRLLYGTSYSVLQRDGFVDVEVGWRWNAPPRPNEVVADVTAGIWLWPDWLLMGQSFTIISAGYGEYPYTSYSLYKTQMSLGWRVAPGLTLQIGAFLSPSGSHVAAERGLSAGVWYDLPAP
ncbi:MAG: hypothetical protein WCD42_00900 [Rhizomicrobium sp.]